MTKINLALDWTPNINHIGFFIAKDLGFYKQEGIEINIIDPAEDNYQLTPGKKLELDLVDFAIAPSETVISLNNKSNKVDAVGVFAILQNDLSSIVSLKSSNIDAPKKLDNKVYASYKARYEDHIVKQMIVNDGGSGNIKIEYPDKLGIWNTLLEGKADATWIFDNWEGIEAAKKNVELNHFSMSNFGIPYGYSPVLLTKKSNIEHKSVAYKKFLKATKKGFLYTAINPIESVNILEKYVTNEDLKNIDLKKSLEKTSTHFGDNLTCGMMDDKRVKKFLEWLVEKKLEKKDILNQDLFSNSILESIQ